MPDGFLPRQSEIPTYRAAFAEALDGLRAQCRAASVRELDQIVANEAAHYLSALSRHEPTPDTLLRMKIAAGERRRRNR